MMARSWTPISPAACRAYATAWWARAAPWKRRRVPVREIESGFSSRDLLQDRHELIDLAHLVEEVIGAGGHAAFAHRGQVVVGQHDDPHVRPVTLVAVAGAGGANHADAAARAQLHVDHDGVVRH